MTLNNTFILVITVSRSCCPWNLRLRQKKKLICRLRFCCYCSHICPLFCSLKDKLLDTALVQSRKKTFWSVYSTCARKKGENLCSYWCVLQWRSWKIINEHILPQCGFLKPFDKYYFQPKLEILPKDLKYSSDSALIFRITKYYILNFNQIIKCLNQIISENKPYNLRLCTFRLHKFQEKNLNDLEVRVRIPVRVQIFLLKFM